MSVGYIYAQILFIGSAPNFSFVVVVAESQTFERDLRLQPNSLDPENFRDGYISVNQGPMP